MPGEEQEDIVMTNNQSTILNITCPLSGKPITELAEPVRGYWMFTSNLSCYSSQIRIINIAELFKMEAFVDLTLFLTFQNLSCFVFPWSSVDCMHVYEKKAIMGYISRNAQAKCPITGIPYSSDFCLWIGCTSPTFDHVSTSQAVPGFCGKIKWSRIHYYLLKLRKCAQWAKKTWPLLW